MEMHIVLGSLILLLVLAIYCALVLSKKTDERIRRYVSEDSADPPMTVRFPDDVFHATNPVTTASTE